MAKLFISGRIIFRNFQPHPIILSFDVVEFAQILLIVIFRAQILRLVFAEQFLQFRQRLIPAVGNPAIFSNCVEDFVMDAAVPPDCTLSHASEYSCDN
jgi:hypothetical protein